MLLRYELPRHILMLGDKRKAHSLNISTNDRIELIPPHEGISFREEIK